MGLEALLTCWTRLVVKLYTPLRVGGRMVLVGDGLKVAKEGRKMPAVKKLHQSSQNNSKAAYIFGHSLQALGLLARGPLGHLCCVPLTSRIHEGVVFSNRDRRTLLDKFAQLFVGVVSRLNAPTLRVVDAYSASRKSLQAPPEGIPMDEVSMETVPRWDSVAHINLILAVEQEFRIALTPEEASYAVSFSEMLALVDAKL